MFTRTDKLFQVVGSKKCVAVRLLAEPDAKIEHIAQRHRVSTHTVRAIRKREAVAIAERKQRLLDKALRIASKAADRVEDQIDGS